MASSTEADWVARLALSPTEPPRAIPHSPTVTGGPCASCHDRTSGLSPVVLQVPGKPDGHGGGAGDRYKPPASAPGLLR